MGNAYRCGFHLFPNMEDAILYADGFCSRGMRVYKVRYRNVTAKGNQSLSDSPNLYAPCIVAREIFIENDTGWRSYRERACNKGK